MTRQLALIVVVLAISTVAVRADIYRWDNGAIIASTIGVDPVPGAGLDHREMEFADLYLRDLSRAQFRSSNLAYASLYESNLTSADFSQANLSFAGLYGATLHNAQFGGALVTGAKLNYATSRGLRREQLYQTTSYQTKQLSHIDLRSNNLREWNFQGQDLTAADFSGSELEATGLDDAIITGAGFSNVTSHGFSPNQLYGTASYKAKNLAGVNLAANNLNQWDFSGQNLTNAVFSFGSLRLANFHDAEIVGAQFNDTTSQGFREDQLYATASYGRKDLRGIELNNNDLSNWDLSGQELSGASFSDTILTGTDVSGAIVSGVRFRSVTSKGFTSEQLYSTASYKAKDLSRVLFVGNDLSGWNFNGQNLSGASLDSYLTNTDFTNSNISGAYLRITTPRGFTRNQLYLTASYQAKDLRNVDLGGNNLRDWDFTAQNLTNARFDDSNLWGANFRDAVVVDANFSGAMLTDEQLYSTASYQQKNLQGIQLSFLNLTGFDFQGQDLRHAGFYRSTLADVDFRMAVIDGTHLSNATSYGFTSEQLYSTASYLKRDLHGIYLDGSNLDGWNLRHQNLMNSNLYETTLNGADLSYADLRGSMFIDPTEVTLRNTIRESGVIEGVELLVDEQLAVRNHYALPERGGEAIPIFVTNHMAVAGGILQLVFESDLWNSLISFEENIPVQLGGTLELTFTADVDLLSQVGRTIRIFDWTGVEPTGAFAVASAYPWDLSELYTTGEITFLLPGDTNGDQAVTIADLNNVRNNFGAAGGLGDTNGDQQIDIQDLNNVRNFFGASTPQAVPEPSSLMLAALVACGLVVFRRRTLSVIAKNQASRPAHHIVIDRR